MERKTIVIKLGTNYISNEDRTLNKEVIKAVVSQISSSLGEHNILLVTSGAVGAGRSIVDELRYDETTNKQIFAAVGQVELMHIYSTLFKAHNQTIAQILATKADFSNRDHYLNMKNCLESLMKEKVVPIMNENDVVAIEELMFTDNDELAALISQMISADMLIIATNVEGVYDDNGAVISTFQHDDPMPTSIKEGDKSSFGKGGMMSKFKTAQTAASNGADVFIVGACKDDFILRLISGESLGTKFVAKKIGNK